MQIALGGWTSTNYAATACPDFPTCQARWWPHTDFRNAFVLWHAQMNYEGGVLDNPARVAIHFTHRLGALVATAALGWRRSRAADRALNAADRAPGRCWLPSGLQLAIGIRWC